MTKSRTTVAILVTGLMIGAATLATAEAQGAGQTGPGMTGQQTPGMGRG